MRIGITYDLKSETPPAPRPDEGAGGVPDDLQEEFDNPATVEAIASVLRGLGHEVEKLGDGRELVERLLARPPEFVFNFAEGQGVGRSREARVPAVLEMLGIPHTGSDPLTLAVTLDKECAKRLVRHEGVAVPEGVVIEPGVDPYDALGAWASGGPTSFPFPAIAKPAWEGSSKGIRGKCLVEDPRVLSGVVEALRRDYLQPVLLEQFIPGDELTVGMVGNDPPQVMGVMRVLPRQPTDRFIYSLEVKRDYLRQVRYECPARLPAPVLDAAEEAAGKAYRALGCRDVCGWTSASAATAPRISSKPTRCPA